MPSVEEILRQTGFSNSEIQQLDPRAYNAFEGVLSAAEAARQQAELIGRSNTEFYESSIVPGLTSWTSEKEQLEAAKIAAERKARWLEAAARESGILEGEPSRDGQGRFVAGAPGGTPGSPTFSGDMNEFALRAGNALGTLADIQWRYESLYGSKLPVSPSQLVAEADRQGLNPLDYASRKFNFEQKEREIQQQKQTQHDDAIRREVAAAKDKEWAEKTGNNPDVRHASQSRIPELQRKVQSKEMADPLLMNERQRQQATSRMISDAIKERREQAS